jgi:hypothetical protein
MTKDRTNNFQMSAVKSKMFSVLEPGLGSP